MVTNNVGASGLVGWGYALSQRFWPYFGGSRHSLVSYREPPGGVRPVDLLLIRPEYYVLQRALSKQSLIVKVTVYGIRATQEADTNAVAYGGDHPSNGLHYP